MLRLLTKNRFINTSTWQTYFSREFDKRLPDKINPLISQEVEPELNLNKPMINDMDQMDENKSTSKVDYIPFLSLSLETKLELLNDLCEWQLDEPDRLRDHLDHEDDAVQWRVEPVGYDAKGNSYWLFDDNRLYKESKPIKRKSQNEPEGTGSDDEENWLPWKLVCISVKDWKSFPERFADSTNSDEQYFYKLLVNDVLPKVVPVIEENEKIQKKHEAIASRKRSSRLIVREIEALEKQQQIELELLSKKEGGYSEELSRSEKRRLEKEKLEKERKTKEREARLLERERKQEEKLKAEEKAAEKARLERERRLQRRTGGDDIEFLNQSATDYNINNNLMHNQESSTQLHHENNIKAKKSANKTSRKSGKDQVSGKRKRSHKLKVNSLQQQYDDEGSWVFNCICGLFGNNLDDGTPMIACEKCNEWQHIECLCNSKQIPQNTNDLDQITFICQRCADEDKMDIDIDIDIDDVTDDEKAVKKQDTSITKGDGFYSSKPIQQIDNDINNTTTLSSNLIPPIRLPLRNNPQQQQKIINSIYPSSSSSSSSLLNNNNNNNNNTNIPIAKLLDHHHQSLNELNQSRHSPKVTIINKVPTNISSFRHTVQPHLATNSSSSSFQTSFNDSKKDSGVLKPSIIHKENNFSSNNTQHQHHQNQKEPSLLGNYARYDYSSDSSHSKNQHSSSNITPAITLSTTNGDNNTSNNNDNNSNNSNNNNNNNSKNV
ncbi:unnamed protein product [Cunninghamella blakesleeana]